MPEERSGTTRHSSRILLLAGDGAALLFLTAYPRNPTQARWITPGGGLDPGETHEQAAVRELREETGLAVETLGEPIWIQDFTVGHDYVDHAYGHAEFFLHRVPEPFEPSTAEWTPEEHRDVHEWRWWSIDDLLAAEDRYRPLELPELMRRFLG